MMSSVCLGFVLLAFNLLCLLVLKNLVVVSFSFIPLCCLSISRLMMLAVLCRVSFVSRINRFVSFPCRRQIITLQETSFLSRSPPGSTHRSPLSYVVTSIRYLTARSIVLGRMLLIPRERVPLHSRTCLMCVVLSTPGVTFILHPRVLPG